MLFLLGDGLFIHERTRTNVRIIEAGTDGKGGSALGKAVAEIVIDHSFDRMDRISMSRPSRFGGLKRKSCGSAMPLSIVMSDAMIEA